MKRYFVLALLLTAALSMNAVELSTLLKGQVSTNKIGSAVLMAGGLILNRTGGNGGQDCAVELQMMATPDTNTPVTVTVELVGGYATGALRYQFIGGSDYINSLYAIYSNSNTFTHTFTTGVTPLIRIWADGISTSQKVKIKSISYVVDGTTFTTTY
jgi:hypothetical protein